MAKANLVSNKKPKTLDERKLALLKAQQVRDKMFDLVVKIISWETGSLNSFVVKAKNKISAVEWSQYKKYQLDIPTTASIDKVKKKLNTTYQSIIENGGFE